MKYIKIFENNPFTYIEQDFNKGQYLVNKDVENIEKVEMFINDNNLNYMIKDIWNYSKNELNIYPDKITNNEILYLTKDGCKVIIHIENGIVTTISKIKIEMVNQSFKPNVISTSDFSFEKFKHLIEN